MSNSKFKRINKFLSSIFFVVACFAMSFCLVGLKEKKFASAEESSDYYQINLQVDNGLAILSYVGDGEHYVQAENIFLKESDTSYKILKVVADDVQNDYKIRIENHPNENYVLNYVLVNEATQTSNEFKVSGDTTVSVSNIAKTFTVSVSTQFTADGTNFSSDQTLLTNNTGASLDNISVSAFQTLFESDVNVLANQCRESDHLEFVGYFIKDEMMNEVDISDGLKIQDLIFDNDFIASYVRNDKLEIVAKFAFKKQVTVSVDDTCQDLGDFQVVLKNPKNEIVDFVSGNYYSYGSKLSVVPVPEKFVDFSGYNINDTEQAIYSDTVSLNVGFDDIDLKLFFAPEKYEIIIDVENSVGENIGSGNVSVATSKNLPYVTSHVVSFGETILEIKFKKLSDYQDYNFKYWQLCKNDGTKDTFENLNNIVVDEEFVQNYVSNGEIVFVGVFALKCQLSIIMDEAYPTTETFVVYENDKAVSISKSFEYGTELVVSVPNIDHMRFIGFDGLVDSDQYAQGSTLVYITMLGSRTLSAKYEYVETELKVSEDSKMNNARLQFSSNKIKIGDTLVLNANVSSGKVVKDFKINGKSAKDFVDLLNKGQTSKVAIYGDEGIITVYVNKDVYDFFAQNSTLKVEIKTKTNGLYVGLFVVYVVLTLGFGAVIAVFAILANKKSFKIKDLKRKQDKRLKEKEEENKNLESQKTQITKDEPKDENKEILEEQVKKKTTSPKTSNQTKKSSTQSKKKSETTQTKKKSETGSVKKKNESNSTKNVKTENKVEEKVAKPKQKKTTTKQEVEGKKEKTSTKNKTTKTSKAKNEGGEQ